jgi:hypothetical protein
MIYGLAAVSGQASPVEPSLPPHPHSASPMKELPPLSILTWQLPAAQELYRHLSALYPLPSVHTLDCIHSYTDNICSAAR